MAVSKLVVALVAGAIAVLLANPASAQRPAPNPSPPKPPVEQPIQIMPAGIYPLTPEREATLKAKSSFKECDACPEMVVVPKGSFTMGTPMNEVDRDNRDFPQHRVTIARPFAVGRFTISFDEWDACLADGGCDGNKGDEKGFGRGRLPAQGINFAAVKSYLAWLSRKVGRTYRLPSEAEREYFTRAGTSTPFWFGKTISPLDANYRAATPYGGGPRGIDSKGPVVVDSYAPNPFGLYQVHGNIPEWTEDCYNKRYTEDTPNDGSPWLEGDCTKRVVRGGIWSWSADVSRAGARDDSSVDSGGSFRVIRNLGATP
jgi:formylglycine-generating enzyme required for sulfatase activity